MNEKLPYEEHLHQQWNELPLPDEDMAWEDMKRRLDEEDDSRRFMLWWRPGCGLGALLLLVLLATGWWMIRPEKWLTHKKRIQQSSINKKVESVDTKRDLSDTAELPETTDNSKLQPGFPEELPAAGIDNRANTKSIKPDTINHKKEKVLPGKRVIREIDRAEKPKALVKQTTIAANKKRENKLGDKAGINNEAKPVVQKKDLGKDQKAKPTVPAEPEKSKDITEQDQKPVDSSGQVVVSDITIAATDRDSLVKRSPATDTATTKSTVGQKKNKKNSFFVSSGLALQQQVPVAGQKATPYNSLGRKSTLMDYIPSVYLRLNRTNKWFVQAEFRYGAPQYTKEFVYDQQIIMDSSGVFSNITSQKLKKTYYHQLPVTFNYYILPNWSIGGGLVWNKFYSAISEREIIQRNNQTQADSVISKGVINRIKDSATGFSKSYFQAVFETQYQWKRLSLGMRYSFGLEPYIKFNLPGSGTRDEKNSSLQVFLRYELWKSNK